MLYIEKEGFDPIFEAAGISERFDIAPMSSKGMSVTAGAHAGRGALRAAGLPLFILHDFDKAASRSRRRCSHDTARYTFKHKVET